MTQSYIFNQPGSIPGIPGLFANVTVTIADDGTITQEPLIVPPHIVEDAPIEDSNATDPELPAITAQEPEQQEEAPTPEQEVPAPVLYTNGG